VRELTFENFDQVRAASSLSVLMEILKKAAFSPFCNANLAACWNLRISTCVGDFADGVVGEGESSETREAREFVLHLH